MIISFVNNKGGVLKTTMATNVAGSLVKLCPEQRKVILDLDGQGNVSASFGQNPERLNNTLIDILLKVPKFNGANSSIEIDDCLLPVYEGLDILPCNFELNFADIDIARKKYKASDIAEIVKQLTRRYDFVLLDTPPNMATLVSTAMSLSDVIVIPFEPDQYSMLGLMRIVETIDTFKEKNPNLKTILVPTKVNMRTRLHNDVIELVKSKAHKNNVVFSEHFVSLTSKSSAAVGYEKLPISLVSPTSNKKYQTEYLEITKEILNLVNHGHQ